MLLDLILIFLSMRMMRMKLTHPSFPTNSNMAMIWLA